MPPHYGEKYPGFIREAIFLLVGHQVRCLRISSFGPHVWKGHREVTSWPR